MPLGYSVIIDRISQDVPFYRASLKNAAITGTAVINNPFWWSADEKFFNNSIDSKSMAKTIRQVNFLIALNAIREDGFMKTETVNIEDGFFWLNELAEILDPYLGIE